MTNARVSLSILKGRRLVDPFYHLGAYSLNNPLNQSVKKIVESPTAFLFKREIAARRYDSRSASVAEGCFLDIF
mgnify:CR=1 FL=1